MLAPLRFGKIPLGCRMSHHLSAFSERIFLRNCFGSYRFFDFEIADLMFIRMPHICRQTLSILLVRCSTMAGRRDWRILQDLLS